MDIPRGHAVLPLNEAEFLDFIFNYFKAEYSPIRSLWSTATAIPNSPLRWKQMGNELFPLSFRPANAQAQNDIDSLDCFVRKWNLDAQFLKGVVIRFAKYEEHERLEKKLFECCRVDLMVRKALKEKHLIDRLWPSPAPRNIPHEFLQQGVQVRKWYGDMFGKYFKHLHSVEDFSLRPEIDQRIKSSTTLMLVPFVDHLVFGSVDPIMPVVAKGAGYSNTGAWKQVNEGEGVASTGHPARFEVRFDGAASTEETYVKNVVRQCQCLNCGSKRDVNINICVDPAPEPTTSHAARSKNREGQGQGSGRRPSRTAMKYSPGYFMPGVNDPTLPRRTQQPPARDEPQDAPQNVRPQSPQQKKQCPACTFLNHPDLTTCEMCQGDLPATAIPKPLSSAPAPERSSSKQPSRHAHSASVPPPATQKAYQKESFRPGLPNRQSISSTLFSILPFSQAQQSEHHVHVPPTQPDGTKGGPEAQAQPLPQVQSKGKSKQMTQARTTEPGEVQRPVLPARKPSTPSPISTSNILATDHDEPQLSNKPEMAMMPLTPPPTSTYSKHPRPMPAGLPRNLMDDFVPVSHSPFLREQEDEDAGWGEVSRDEARRDEDSSDEEEEVGRARGSTEGMIDLDAVAREEMGVWGERED